MPNCFTSLLLVVVTAIVVQAHDKTLALIEKAEVTSQGQRGPAALQQESSAAAAAASVERLDNLDKTKDERATSSAVLDWSLVCQQLCGAALGGAACFPYCGNVAIANSLQLANAEVLMASQKQHICPKLCGLQLGDAVCTCKNFKADINKRSSNESQAHTNNVCAIFCDNTHVTLTGCSPCNIKQIATTKLYVKPSGETFTETKVSKMLLNESCIIPATTAAARAVTETTATATAAAAARAGTITTTAATTGTATTMFAGTTTPNWKEVCAALCKTGDGGSLCNCNLSPFMM